MGVYVAPNENLKDLFHFFVIEKDLHLILKYPLYVLSGLASGGLYILPHYCGFICAHALCPEQRISCYSLLHSLTFFLLPLLQWSQSLWRGIPHRAENSVFFFFFYELYKVSGLCDDHHLLQTEVSGMSVEPCFNVWHRLGYY